MHCRHVKHRTKIRWSISGLVLTGVVIISVAYVALLGMGHWPQNPAPITNRFFTLQMPAPPQPGVPTERKISAWVGVIFKGSSAGVPAAEKRLIAAGVAAVPALRQAMAGPTRPSIRGRLRLVLTAIARTDALRGPLITLKLQKATLQTVFTRLCLPVGIHPDFYPMMESGAPPPLCFQHDFLNINIQRQPFWRVMQSMARLTGVSPTANGFSGPGLHIGAQPPMLPGIFSTSMPVDIQGAFVFAPQWPWYPPASWRIPHSSLGREIQLRGSPVLIRHQLRAVNTRRVGGAAAGDKLLLLVNVLWCPAGNRLITFDPLQITQAVDNTGRSLFVPARPDVPWRANWNSFWSASGQMIVFNCRVWLKQPAAGAKELRMLRGNFPVRLCFDRRVYHIKNLSSGKGCLYWHGLKVRFRRPVMAAAASGPGHQSQWRVRLWIDSDVASRRQRLQAGNLGKQFEEMGAIKFFAADGRCLAASLMGSYYGANWKGSYKYDIIGGRPVGARITLYQQTNVQISVPFVLKNVPLPRPK